MRRRPCPEAHAQLGHRHRRSNHLSSYGRFGVSGQNASDLAGYPRRTQSPPVPLPQITVALTDSLMSPGTVPPNTTSAVPNPNQKLSHPTAATGRSGSPLLWLQERESRGPREERSSSSLVRHSHERLQMVPLGQLDEILRDDELQPPATRSSEHFV